MATASQHHTEQDYLDLLCSFLWDTVVDDQRIKQLVQRVPAIRQQEYGDLIKHLRVNTSNGIDLSHLAFQKMQKLEVNTRGVGPHVNLPIAQFIQQELRYLTIKGDPALTNGTVSKFLPQLSRAPFLKEIWLTGAIINAHPQDLVEGWGSVLHGERFGHPNESAKPHLRVSPDPSTFESGWHQSAYLVSDVIRVMDIIGKAYPELLSLTMNVSVYDPTSAEFSAEVGPLIPKLEYLKMNYVVETLPMNDQHTW
ncbi:hypothetical protein D6D01_05520 [Aureobasidium pullulans]|uniref:Uncharacterized protein n=1 Tax=Aureobasidium pullulans TaxID=5580 RepID=A0A4V4JV71_AURPU|nr:hypothetical protein D6D01_05520 [Aureobasidium pullulans]